MYTIQLKTQDEVAVLTAAAAIGAATMHGDQPSKGAALIFLTASTEAHKGVVDALHEVMLKITSESASKRN